MSCFLVADKASHVDHNRIIGENVGLGLRAGCVFTNCQVPILFMAKKTDIVGNITAFIFNDANTAILALFICGCCPGLRGIIDFLVDLFLI